MSLDASPGVCHDIQPHSQAVLPLYSLPTQRLSTVGPSHNPPQQLPDDGSPPNLGLNGYVTPPMMVPVNGVSMLAHPAFLSSPGPNVPAPEDTPFAGGRQRFMTFVPTENPSHHVPATTTTTTVGHGAPTAVAPGEGNREAGESLDANNTRDASNHIGALVPEQGCQQPRRARAQRESRRQKPSSNTDGPCLVATSAGRVPGDPERSTLQLHLVSYFASQEFADCRLELSHARRRFEGISIPAHRILLSRSPFLKSQLKVVDDTRPANIIRLTTADRFVTADAVYMVLRCLYGAPMQEVFGWWSTGSPETAVLSDRDMAEKVDGILAVAAAGTLFQLSHIVAEAVRMVPNLIRWHTLERVLAFAIEAQFNRGRRGTEAGPVQDVDLKQTNSKDASQSHGDLNHAEHHGCVMSGFGSSSATPPPDQLLHAALDYIIRQFPRNFLLNPSATSSIMPPRFRNLADEQDACARHPRLRSIKFGDYPSEDEEVQLDPSSPILSRILLSLPFPPLQWILESKDLAGSDMATRRKMAQSVVYEREQRRERVLKDSPVSYQDRIQNGDVWEAAGWEELVKVEDREEGTREIRLERRWRGFQGPRPSCKGLTTSPFTSAPLR